MAEIKTAVTPQLFCLQKGPLFDGLKNNGLGVFYWEGYNNGKPTKAFDAFKYRKK